MEPRNQAQSVSGEFQKEYSYSNGTLHISPKANKNYFCIKDVSLLAFNDQLILAGNLSYRILDKADIELIDYRISGTYQQEELDQTILKLMSSGSPDKFIRRFQ